MATTTRQKTYLPEDAEMAPVRELLSHLQTELEQTGRMVLMSASGEQFELPATLFDVLRFVGTALTSGNGVTVMPRDTRLTTQDAADFLGISRPTLVKILESGAIPFETVGRHRRVMLDDLLEYQERERAHRRTLLAQTARNNQESGMLALTVMQ
jgi:excisionase family DNA binding protein